MHTIALEEHYATQALLDAQAKNPVFDLRALPPMPMLDTQLCDLDTGRIAAMDAAAIDLQVLSLMTPGVEQLDAVDAVAVARDANDQPRDRRAAASDAPRRIRRALHASA